MLYRFACDRSCAIVAVDCANAGGNPIEFTMSIGDLAIINTALPPNGGIASSDLGAIFPLTLSKGLSLKFTVTSGASEDFSAKVAVQYRCV